MWRSPFRAQRYFRSLAEPASTVECWRSRLLVSFATGIAFGFFPALQISALDLNNALKESGRGSTSGTHNRVRGGLIVSEVALALTLLIGAGLLFESFWRLWSTPTGFNPKGALVLDISLPEAKWQALYWKMDDSNRRTEAKLLKRLHCLECETDRALSRAVEPK